MERRESDFARALSERERQLLDLASEGCTDNAISHRLGISLATVNTYWGRIRIKLGPLNRTELVAVYIQEQATKTLDEMRDRNKVLMTELAEHAQTVSMLKSSLELFRGLIETAPDGILLVSEEGLVELANEQAESMFGYAKDELLGKHVEFLVPDRYRGQHKENREEYHQHPTKRQMGHTLPTFALRKDGSEFRMATALSAAQTPRGLLITCIVRDLTNPGPFLEFADEDGESHDAEAV